MHACVLRVYIYIYVNTGIHAYVCVYIYRYRCSYKFMHVYAYVYICICVLLPSWSLACWRAAAHFAEGQRHEVLRPLKSQDGDLGHVARPTFLGCCSGNIGNDIVSG